MDAKFLSLYNQELTFIRESGAEFAKEYPKIAGRLGLEGFDCADPYVERLLEGFAFLSARVHRKLDASFPEFTQHLLSLLFPTFLDPVPSALIAQFNPDLEEGSLLAGVTIKASTALHSQLGKDEQTACEYTTAQDVLMWPITIAHAEYLNAQELSSMHDNAQRGLYKNSASNAQQHTHNRTQTANAAIKIVLQAPPGIRFSAMNMDTLSLYIRGTESFPYHLFEAMFKGFNELLYKTGNSLWRTSPSKAQLKAKGFNKDDALLPYCNRQFDGFRLLREYFTFPNRFLFLDLDNLKATLAHCHDSTVELLITLDKADVRLENRVSKDNFALHCAPAINLFKKRAERISVSRKTHEFHIVPDKLRPLDFEVCSVNAVRGFGNSVDVQRQLLPLYSHQHSEHAPANANTHASVNMSVSEPRSSLPGNAQSSTYKSGGFYTTKRAVRTLNVNERKFGHRSSYVGSELYLSIVDPKSAPFSDDLEQLSVDAMCSNRDLPLMMPLGKGNTDFTIETGEPCSSVRCVGEPTRPSSPLNDGSEAWDLINILSINFLGFTRDEKSDALVALKKLLLLMSDQSSHSQRKQIDGLVAMDITQITGRLPLPGPVCFARGLQISITVDETAYEGSSAFMLGMLLDTFFAQYVGINSFSKLVLVSSNQQEIHQWPIRIGSHSPI